MFTDGACSRNPGPGGYGVLMSTGNGSRELSGGFRETTNNRMEMMGVIVGLEALKTRCSVIVYSDSQYVVNAISQGWAERWRANGWMRNKKERAINPDLWARLLDLCQRHDVKFRWVRGHSGHPENERVDRLATAALAQPGLPQDPGYDKRG